MERKEFENDYKESNKKYFIIIIMLCVALLAMIGLYATRELTSKDDNKTNNTQNNTNNTPQKEDDKQNNEEKKDKEMIWSNREPGVETVYDVFLKNKQLYVNEKMVDEKIKEFITVTLGSDVCIGSTYVIVLKEDNTVGALSLDGLVCGNEVQYNEKVNNLENVKKIYFEKIGEEMGIEHNAAYVDTTETTKVNISDYLEDK